MSTPKTPMGVFLTGFSTDLPTGVDETLWTGETEAMLNARTSGRLLGAVAAIIIIL